jgi:hypothetical protein
MIFFNLQGVAKNPIGSLICRQKFDVDRLSKITWLFGVHVLFTFHDEPYLEMAS